MKVGEDWAGLLGIVDVRPEEIEVSPCQCGFDTGQILLRLIINDFTEVPSTS